VYVEASDVVVGSAARRRDGTVDMIIAARISEQPWMGGMWLTVVRADGSLRDEPNDYDDDIDIIAP